MKQSKYLEAIHEECRKCPEFAHAWALCSTREDIQIVLDGDLSSQMRMAVVARRRTVQDNSLARAKRELHHMGFKKVQ